jgi:hypothetical protein
MNKNRFLLYDSTDTFSNDVIQELKNNNLLSTFLLVDKNNYDHNKIHLILKNCLVKCELPTLLIPDINIPIEKNNVLGWIKSISLFNIKTNNFKNKEQKLTQPSPQDKLGIPKQEIKKISDNYTFIDDKNTDKLFQSTHKTELILDNTVVIDTVIVDNKKRILHMLRGKK